MAWPMGPSPKRGAPRVVDGQGFRRQGLDGRQYGDADFHGFFNDFYTKLMIGQYVRSVWLDKGLEWGMGIIVPDAH